MLYTTSTTHPLDKKYLVNTASARSQKIMQSLLCLEREKKPRNGSEMQMLKRKGSECLSLIPPLTSL
ncbi:hypothetical protein BS50DRAFT_575569 [Corynespora cassiicola Philippines]|uniref:Uncharacterized protein n=1 Tax=Corynespora cassiicola Philippines TaxID=1448308 RepID=A0A2T2NJJ0_CORCC|nr:hypothetical protein BS50DRAFT_575569 [Corynespora cassiicola Philippines]